jgi:hypothetical protein
MANSLEHEVSIRKPKIDSRQEIERFIYDLYILGGFSLRDIAEETGQRPATVVRSLREHEIIPLHNPCSDLNPCVELSETEKYLREYWQEYVRATLQHISGQHEPVSEMIMFERRFFDYTGHRLETDTVKRIAYQHNICIPGVDQERERQKKDNMEAIRKKVPDTFIISVYENTRSIDAIMQSTVLAINQDVLLNIPGVQVAEQLRTVIVSCLKKSNVLNNRNELEIPLYKPINWPQQGGRNMQMRHEALVAYEALLQYTQDSILAAQTVSHILYDTYNIWIPPASIKRKIIYHNNIKPFSAVGNDITLRQALKQAAFQAAEQIPQLLHHTTTRPSNVMTNLPDWWLLYAESLKKMGV